VEQDGIYFNLLMEKNDFTNTPQNLLSQSRVKKGSEFTASTNDKLHAEQDGIYLNLLMEKNDFTATNHHSLTQSRVK